MLNVSQKKMMLKSFDPEVIVREDADPDCMSQDIHDVIELERLLKVPGLLVLFLKNVNRDHADLLCKYQEWLDRRDKNTLTTSISASDQEA